MKTATNNAIVTTSLVRDINRATALLQSATALLQSATTQMGSEVKVTPTVAKSIDKDRPTFRAWAVTRIKKNGDTDSVTLKNDYEKEHGEISWHSVYRVLKDKRQFKCVNDLFGLIQHKAKKAAAKAA